MASSFRVESQSYKGRYLYLACEQIEKNIATATSQVKWTLVATGGESSYYTTGPTTAKINGQTVYYKGKTDYSTEKFPAAKGSVGGVVTIPHDELGNAEVQVSIKTNIYTGVVKTNSGTWTLDRIDRYANIDAGYDFTDEENPKIDYANYAGDKVDSLQVAISVDGKTELIPYRDVPVLESSYSLLLTETERDALLSATPNSNSLPVIYLLKTKIGESTGITSAGATMKVVNANPQVDPVIVDTNEATISVTGDSSILVANHSVASVTINAKALKKATISSQSVTHDDVVLPGDGSLPILSAEPIRITAKDSRGNITELNAENTIVPYIDPTCIILHSLPDGNGEMDLVVVGNAYNGNIGKTNNAITVQYRHKEDSGVYSEWIAIDDVDRTENEFTAQTLVTGLNYRAKHTFQARVIDEVAKEGVLSTEKTFKAEPTFDFSETDFCFHVPVFMSGKKIADLAQPENPGDAVPLGYKDPQYLSVSGDEMESDLSMGGNRIAKVASPVDSLDAVNKSYADTKLSVVKLWENENPSDTFYSQTVSIDLSCYDFVSIYYKNIPSGASYFSSGIVPIGDRITMQYVSTSGSVYHRHGDVSESGISFSAGQLNGEASNSAPVPLKIYGWKGLLAINLG